MHVETIKFQTMNCLARVRNKIIQNHACRGEIQHLKFKNLNLNTQITVIVLYIYV